MKYCFYYRFEIGMITVIEENDRIVQLLIDQECDEDVEVVETVAIYTTYVQLRDYFNGKRKSFDLKVKLDVSEFQRKVLNAILDIPYGEVKTYQDIAKEIGNEKACQAVGNACGSNPLPLIIPCHRVVNKDGLGNYAFGSEIKKELLELETDFK